MSKIIDTHTHIYDKQFNEDFDRVMKDIEEKMEYLIFPYMIDNKKISIISEENFKNNFNKAYTYLSFFKEELSKRDNGNKKYEKWYAFGRNQALTINGDKLLFPYISNSPYFVYTDIKDLLLYVQQQEEEETNKWAEDLINGLNLD